MSVLAAVAAWFWSNTAGNIAASIMVGAAAWFWKIRPHLQRQAEHRVDVETHMLAQDDRHRTVEAWFAQVHDRFDKLEQPGRHAERQEFHGQIAPGDDGRRGE